MNIVTVARPYAKAAFFYAKDKKMLDTWRVMLNYMKEIVSNKEVEKLLRSKALGYKEKFSIVTAIAGDNLNDAGRNFLKILVKNKRILLVPSIFDLFVKMQQEFTNIIPLQLASVKPLDNVKDITIINSLQTRFVDKKVILENTVDAKMLSGIKIKVGDRVLDASLRNKLNLFYQHIRQLGGVNNGNE